MPELSFESKWKGVLGNDFTKGNTLRFLIGGRNAFEAIYRAIQKTREPTDFIYLLAWWLDLDVPLSLTYGKPDPSSTMRVLLKEKAAKGVQIRIILWDNWAKPFLPHDTPDELGILLLQGLNPIGYIQNRLNQLARNPTTEPAIESSDPNQSHRKIAAYINGLPGAAAVVDWYTAFLVGSHHQKLLCTRTNDEGVVSLCGGADINRDRIEPVAKRDKKGKKTHGKGTPLHDVHCEVRGPAAEDLVKVFVQRWDAHPDTPAIENDPKRGPLLGRNLHPQREVKRESDQFVRVAVTYNYVKVTDSLLRNPATSRRYACKLERSTRDGLLVAIASASSFIYFEDQYMISLAVADALSAAGAKVKYVLGLITNSFICDLPGIWTFRKQFIERARIGLGDKLKLYYLIDPSHSDEEQQNTYVHAKTWIFDDELAYIGTANINNRGLSSDSEVGILAGDEISSVHPHFAHDLRVGLWKQHLGLEVNDPIKEVDRWESATRVRRYNPDAGKDDVFPGIKPDQLRSVIDPDAEGLPQCPMGLSLARRLLRPFLGSSRSIGKGENLYFFYHGTDLSTAKKLQKNDIGVFDIEWHAVLDYSDHTDFGKGFYTFPQEFKILAVERAKDTAKRKGERWAVVRFEFPSEELRQIANILLFENKKSRPQNAPRVPVTVGEPANWLQFVEYNRGLKQYPQRPKDNDWTDQYGWMRGPLWVPRDSGMAKGRPRFADHIHQINWGRSGLMVMNSSEAKKRRALFTRENEDALSHHP